LGIVVQQQRDVTEKIKALVSFELIETMATLALLSKQDVWICESNYYFQTNLETGEGEFLFEFTGDI
jgi:hypothetical protein